MVESRGEPPVPRPNSPECLYYDEMVDQWVAPKRPTRTNRWATLKDAGEE